MTIHILPPEQQSSYDQQVLEMLKEGDNEFVPPLSFRSSTIQSDLSAAQAVGDGVMCYFQEMKKQRLLVAAEVA